MNYFGIATIIIASITIFFGWKQFQSGKIKLAIISLVVAGFFLRIFTISDPFLHKWDERYHALVAKNLIENPLKPTLYKNPVLPYNFRHWTANHVWLHKQPVPLWIISLSLKSFGINEIALRIPSLLVSTIGVLLMFLIGKNLFDEKVGFFSSFLFAIHGMIIELTGGRIATDHTDVFFLFFILLGVYLSIEFAKKKKQYLNILCGISVGLAILTKWLPALIVIPIWFLVLKGALFKKFTDKELVRNLIILLGCILVVASPWQIYIHNQFPLEAGWEQNYNRLHIFEALENHGHPFYWHIDNMRMFYGELVYIPVIWFLYKTIFKRRSYKRLLILIWLIIPFAFFSVVATKMPAYTLISAPSIFIICALFWRYLGYSGRKFHYKKLPQLIILGLIILPIRYSIERVKPFEIRNEEWMSEMIKLKEKNKGEKLIIFNSDHPIEMMFYLDCIAYESLPNPEVIEDLKNQGYKIVIQ